MRKEHIYIVVHARQGYVERVDTYINVSLREVITKAQNIWKNMDEVSQYEDDVKVVNGEGVILWAPPGWLCKICGEQVAHQSISELGSKKAEYCRHCGDMVCLGCIDWALMTAIKTVEIICMDCGKKVRKRIQDPIYNQVEDIRG